MKRITAILLAAAVCAVMFSCSSGGQSDGEAFAGAKPAVGRIASGFLKELFSSLFKPSSDMTADSDAEYTYKTEEGEQTAHVRVGMSVRAEDGAVAASVGGVTVSYDGTLRLDGAQIGYGEEIDDIVAAFAAAFMSVADADEYSSAPDSIRSGDDDVEVTRYTLKLSRTKYHAAADKAIRALDSHRSAAEDLLGFYCRMHGLDETGAQAYEKLVSELSGAFAAGSDELVWQRYVGKDGKTLAERFKTGDLLIRYLCARTDTYDELTVYAEIGDREIEMTYNKRMTGLSDSFNVRMTESGRVTYFDGEISSAYRSGSVRFDLRATKDALTVSGFEIKVGYNGASALSASGSGSTISMGERIPFTFKLDFIESDAAIPEKTADPIGLTKAAELMSQIR